MTINVEILGPVPYPLAPDDEFQINFDISSWLGTDTIASVAYSAIDEDEDVVTACYDSEKSVYTNTVIKPYLKGGGTDDKKYIVKAQVTTTNTYKKSFYIDFRVSERLQ